MMETVCPIPPFQATFISNWSGIPGMYHQNCSPSGIDGLGPQLWKTSVILSGRRMWCRSWNNLDYNATWRPLITTTNEEPWLLRFLKINIAILLSPFSSQTWLPIPRLWKTLRLLANYESAKKEVEKRVPNLSKERVRVCKRNFILCFLFLFRFGGYSYLSTVK